MTIEQLLTLEAIIQTGSFRKASEHLHKAQSAVSYAIKSLEDEYQLQIFSRDMYRPQLTAKGRSFYKKAKEVIDKAGELEQFGKSISELPESRIRISVSPLCPMNDVNKTLKHIIKKFPQTQVSLRMSLLKGEEDLLEDRADLAIIERTQTIKKLSYVKLSPVDMPIVASARHSLAKNNRALTSADIHNYPQIVVAGHYDPDVRKYTGIIEGANLWFVSGLYTKLRMIKSGLGFGRMPYHMVAKGVGLGSLKIIEFKNQTKLGFKISLSRIKNKPHGLVSDFLWENLRF